ncbi:helix-turn-helix transcriptional regulator [Haloarcula laminariae]|uniref:helix-turn-helix transcriptional regulator n=1 Tax=Haloarcula laminariae TaxID=2961577 RepID=UPI0021C781D4|nr:hypothetical protein [Halomicroarcula laminariae]
MVPRAFPVLLVLLFVAFPAVSAATSTAAAGVGPAAQSAQSQELDPENTTFHVQLRPNGDARWTIIERFNLTDENDTRAFETTRDAFLAGNSDRALLTEFRAANDAAATATGRDMALRNVSRDYEIDGDRGRLVLSFNWTNFAAVNGSRLSLQDAFYTPDGTWLTTLRSDQSLIISPPQGYTLTNSPPDSYFDNGNLRIDGGPTTTFERGDLDIVYEGDSTTQPGPNTGDFPLWTGMSLLLIVGLAAVLLYLNGQDEFPSVGSVGTDSDDGGDAPAPEPPAADGATDDIDAELLSDEERVERLLTRNGGRMKQARIVKETGWSNAKVSQLLSSMDEDGRIDKLRIGRENLISFPDEDVTEIED